MVKGKDSKKDDNLVEEKLQYKYGIFHSSFKEIEEIVIVIFYASSSNLCEHNLEIARTFGKKQGKFDRSM